MEAGRFDPVQNMKQADKKSALAAALILGGVAGGLLLMPRIMLLIGDVSVYAGTALAFLFILAPFIILYFRALYQRKHKK